MYSPAGAPDSFSSGIRTVAAAVAVRMFSVPATKAGAGSVAVVLLPVRRMTFAPDVSVIAGNVTGSSPSMTSSPPFFSSTPLVAAIEKAVADFARPFPTRAFVACCGAEGSYAQQATCRLVKVPTIVYFNNFENVFEAVEKGLCPYGVLPVENSAAGSVVAVYDLMQRHRFHIARALRLKVDHVLLAPPGVKLADVKEIVSHPHALAQCSEFLRTHPDICSTPSPNTAVAAKEVAASGRRDVAVIASRACAELYGLDVIAERIQDAVYNYTRFICISKDLEIYPEAHKMSIMLSIPHRPGALAEIISKFAAIDVNLTKLESRPMPGMDFEFRFIFDFMASPQENAVQCLLSELSRDPEIEHFDFLGAYVES